MCNFISFFILNGDENCCAQVFDTSTFFLQIVYIFHVENYFMTSDFGTNLLIKTSKPFGTANEATTIKPRWAKRKGLSQKKNGTTEESRWSG